MTKNIFYPSVGWGGWLPSLPGLSCGTSPPYLLPASSPAAVRRSLPLALPAQIPCTSAEKEIKNTCFNSWMRSSFIPNNLWFAGPMGGHAFSELFEKILSASAQTGEHNGQDGNILLAVQK